jgi:prevent-host-death family protein
MSEHQPGARIRRAGQVGVRELRQNLSVYLRRVRDGETLEVTEHGHGVAYLVPKSRGHVSRRDQLITEGRLIPATHDLLDLEPVEPAPGPSVAEILQQMRDEDR